MVMRKDKTILGRNGMRVSRNAIALAALAIFMAGGALAADDSTTNTHGSAPPSTEPQTDEVPSGYDRQELLACKEKAKPVGKEGFLGVCERHDGLLEMTYTVIYDSTDEISLPSSSRSAEWKAVAHSLDKKAPFGISGIASIKRLVSHYYQVEFQVTVDPDF